MKFYQLLGGLFFVTGLMVSSVQAHNYYVFNESAQNIYVKVRFTGFFDDWYANCTVWPNTGVCFESGDWCWSGIWAYSDPGLTNQLGSGWSSGANCASWGVLVQQDPDTGDWNYYWQDYTNQCQGWNSCTPL